MNRIHDGQGVKANWDVAIQDGKVTPEEARLIVNSAKTAGVSKQEMREAIDVMQEAGSALSSASLMHATVLAVVAARYARGESLTDRQQAGLDTARAESMAALGNAGQARSIGDAVSLERDAQGTTRSMVVDFKDWFAGVFGGDD